MKEKILLRLKTACGKNTATTDITLNKWAEYLSAKITEESQIDAEIEIIKPILDTYDGNMNFVVADAVKKANTVAPPPPAPPSYAPPSTDEPSWFTAFKEKQNADTLELKTKLTSFEKQKQTEEMVTEARKIIYSKYKILPSERALLEKSLDLTLKVSTFDKVDDLVSGVTAQFSDLRSTLGLSGVEPVDGNGGGSSTSKEKPILENLKKNLQREGKLPTPQLTT